MNAPKILQTTEKRQDVRVIFKKPVQFQLRNSGKLEGCLGQDIAQGGMRINVEDFVAVNSEMRIQIKLRNYIEDIIGHVQWVIKVPHADRYQIGLKFDEYRVTPQFRKNLHQYLNSREASPEFTSERR